MPQQYWTTNGADIWRRAEKVICVLTNLDTGQVVRCEDDGTPLKYKPYIAPDFKEEQESKVSKPKVKEERTCLQKYKAKTKKSKHKGIKPTASGKFEAHYWDKAKKINVHLGTFPTETLALAALKAPKKKGVVPRDPGNLSGSELLAEAEKQKALGNYGAHHRLMEEYQESDGLPIIPADTSDL